MKPNPISSLLLLSLASTPLFSASAQSPDQSCAYVAIPGRIAFVVNASVDSVHLAVKKYYVEALLHQLKPRMPWWLEQGLAETLKDATIEGNTCSFGRLRAQEEIVPSNLLEDILADANTGLPSEYLAVLIEPKKRPSPDALAHTVTQVRDRLVVQIQLPSAFNSDYDCAQVPLYPINGDWATNGQIGDFCRRELQKRKDSKNRVLDASTTFNEYFIDRDLPSLTQIFDNHQPDTVQRRMAAWAFVHTALFAEKQRFAGPLIRFASQQASSPNIEETFTKLFGVNQLLFTGLVNEHIRGDHYAVPVYKLDPASLPSPAHKKNTPAPALELVLLHGEILAKSNHLTEAIAYLRDASRRSHLRTAPLLALMGQLEPDEALAFKLLKEAKSEADLPPHAELRLTKLRLASLVVENHRLNLGETGALLEPLLALHKTGYHTEDLYNVVTDIWLASDVKPSEQNLTLVIRGLRQFPTNAQLRQKVANLLEKLELKDEAQVLRQKKP